MTSRSKQVAYQMGFGSAGSSDDGLVPDHVVTVTIDIESAAGSEDDCPSPGDIVAALAEWIEAGLVHTTMQEIPGEGGQQCP